MKTEVNRVIALAGIFQATHLVGQIAHKGITDAEAVQSSIYSLFQTDPENVEAVFGGLSGVKLGLNILANQLAGKNGRDTEIIRYAIALLQLEKKLSNKPDMLKKISDGIQLATERSEHFSINHTNIVGQLADLYSETISTIQPRIMVQGDPAHLNNPENVNKIRCLLLAGIRSAMLWRQCGGKRWLILFGRKKILGIAQQLSHQIEEDRNVSSLH